MKKLQNVYVAPSMTRTVVVAEGRICAESDVKSVKANVQVDEWVTIESEVSFD